jgi:hypothetical protein
MEGRQATCEAGLVVQQIAHDARVEVILDRARCLGPVETYTIVPDNSRHVIDIGFKRDGTLSIGSEST